MKKILGLLIVFIFTTSLMSTAVGNTDVIEKSGVDATNEVENQTAQSVIPSFTLLANATKQEMQVLNEKDLYAKSAVLIDGDSGRILYGKNEDEILPMASTTKIMTLIIALENGNLDDVVTVSKYASTMPDVQLNIIENEQYYLKDLLHSLMLESHNDSAVAIAEHIGGSVQGFADMMNKKAKEIGCENTFYITPNGLDSKITLDNQNNQVATKAHSTTAKELALVMRYCVNLSPKNEEFRKITATPTYSFTNLIKGEDGAYKSGNRSFSCNNHNAFLHLMEGAFSGKTGFTAAAGYCYVGALERDNKCFIVALLACGWPNNKSYKWSDTKKLMNYGLENWDINVLNEIPLEEKKLSEIHVNNSNVGFYHKPTTIPLTYEKVDASETILLNKDEKINVEYDIPASIEAPVKKGQEIGSFIYKVGDVVIKQCKITANKSIGNMNYSCCIEYILDKFMLK